MPDGLHPIQWLRSHPKFARFVGFALPIGAAPVGFLNWIGVVQTGVSVMSAIVTFAMSPFVGLIVPAILLCVTYWPQIKGKRREWYQSADDVRKVRLAKLAELTEAGRMMMGRCTADPTIQQVTEEEFAQWHQAAYQWVAEAYGEPFAKRLRDATGMAFVSGGFDWKIRNKVDCVIRRLNELLDGDK